MRVLFVHQNFPGQFKHLAPALAASPGVEVRSLAMREDLNLPGIQHLRYAVSRSSSTQCHPWVVDAESKVIRAEAAAKAAVQLRHAGFVPDLVCVHPGWGEGLFLKDVFPDARMLSWCEYFYRSTGLDAGFDPEFPGEPFAEWRLRLKNATNLLSLDAMDWGITPTHFQRSTHPPLYQPRISVIHEGINTALARPRTGVRLTLSNGAVINPGDELVTFVNRNLEPVRGFHVFMRALPRILQERPKARVVIVGGNDTSYGPPPTDGIGFRQRMQAELGDRLDLSRVFFMGQVPYTTFLALLQASSVHVYLTYPFVLSWSMLEAMAAGCLVVGSRTAPVSEVITHGRNGLLVDFFDPNALASTVCNALARPRDFGALRVAARQTVVDRYDLRTVCLPQQLALLNTLAEGRTPKANGQVAMAPD